MIVADLSHALLHPRRYLVDFDPRDVPHRFTDVLVLGSGLAGLRAALGVSPEFRVEVVTKGERGTKQFAMGARGHRGGVGRRGYLRRSRRRYA